MFGDAIFANGQPIIVEREGEDGRYENSEDIEGYAPGTGLPALFVDGPFGREASEHFDREGRRLK